MEEQGLQYIYGLLAGFLLNHKQTRGCPASCACEFSTRLRRILKRVASLPEKTTSNLHLYVSSVCLLYNKLLYSISFLLPPLVFSNINYYYLFIAAPHQ